MNIQFEKNGIHVFIKVGEDGRTALRNCSCDPEERTGEADCFPIVEVQGAGYNHNDHHGSKHTKTGPGLDLRYVSHDFSRDEKGDIFTLTQQTDELRVTVRWHFYDNVRVIRAETEIENIGCDVFPLQYVSSFAMTGLGREDCPRDPLSRAMIPHNTWYGECQWKEDTLRELGYDPVNTWSLKRITRSSTGTWACSEQLPMGCYLDKGRAFTWQIETSGSWCWEISDLGGQLVLRLSGPAYEENHFLKRLHRGEKFVSVPCAVAFSCKDFEDTIQELTKYRRLIRRPNEDNEHPTVIFNDYMNCLEGDPTTERELPMIDAAAEAGCKYYCIDAGWYDDGPWWDGVGEWLPAKGRFPGGLKLVLDRIRQRGMIPGLWLELEVMGIHCPLADKLPDDWFFQVDGRRVIDEARYQLDFRNPDVRRHADKVIDRLVNEYGAGYIKMDYNINAGPGTTHNSDSAGEGLLSHTRAYLAWLDDVFARYPGLVIENCSSGGMRMEYSHLSRHSIQSVSDQTDYIKMGCIACNCMTGVTPEQAAIWSYPLENGDLEETAFNMVNAMLLRIHQSGHLARISPERRELVHEGIKTHLSIIDKLRTGLPFWPIGLGDFSSEFLCCGVDCGGEAYLAVWHATEGKNTVSVPMRNWSKAECIYPLSLETVYSAEGGSLNVTLEGVKARLFRLS